MIDHPIDEMGFPEDDDVPLPPRRGRSANVDKRDVKLPAIGRSRFFAGITAIRTITAAASEFVRFHRDAKFRTRAFEKDPKYHEPGIRVWRER